MKITDPNEIKVNVSTLRNVLTDQIRREMKSHPKAFALQVLEDANYPEEFANHMIEKLTLKRVLFVNETVRETMYVLNLSLDRDGIDSLYHYIGLDGPNADRDMNRYEELYPARKFRGC